MMIKTPNKLFSLLFCFVIASLHGDGDQDEKLMIVEVPGAINRQCEDKYLKQLTTDDVNIARVSVPLKILSDFGQDRRIAQLKRVISENSDSKKIIHASLDETATTLNYLAAEYTPEQQVQMVILETILGSANSAIIQRMRIMPAFNKIAHITKWPLAYYWLPYVVKISSPFYWPSGKQAIKSLHKIPTNIPIIIAHQEKDFLSPFRDAAAIYYGLKQQNHDVYFIIKKGNLYYSSFLKDEHKVIRAILYHHGVIDEDDPEYKDIDLSKYQPDPAQFKKDYDNLLLKEKRHEIFGKALIIGAAGLVLAFGKWAHSKFFHA